MFQEKKENSVLFKTEQISGFTRAFEEITDVSPTDVGSYIKCGQTDRQTDNRSNQYVPT